MTRPASISWWTRFLSLSTILFVGHWLAPEVLTRLTTIDYHQENHRQTRIKLIKYLPVWGETDSTREINERRETMSGHGHDGAGHHEEDQSINVKVGVFFICVIIALFMIGMIN